MTGLVLFQILLGVMILAGGYLYYYFRAEYFENKYRDKLGVDEVVYAFKIMEIQIDGNAYILKGIDSIKIKLNGNDFVYHAPKVADFFIMEKSGFIRILPGKPPE